MANDMTPVYECPRERLPKGLWIRVGVKPDKWRPATVREQELWAFEKSRHAEIV